MWRADTLAYTDTAGTIQAVNGQTVKRWNNILGATNPFRQPVGSSAPEFTTNAVNGHAGIRFILDDLMDNVNFNFPRGGTLVLVWSIDTVPGLIPHSALSTVTAETNALHTDYLVTTGLRYWFSGGYRVIGAATGSNQLRKSIVKSTPDSTVVWDQASRTATTYLVTTSTSGVRIGKTNGANLYFHNGFILEIDYYSDAKTDAEIAVLMQYILWRYGF
jgi:hypothetical protein